MCSCGLRSLFYPFLLLIPLFICNSMGPATCTLGCANRSCNGDNSCVGRSGEVAMGDCGDPGELTLDVCVGIYTLLARMPGGLVLDTHDHLVVHRRDPPLLILHCGTDYAYIRHPIPTLLDPVQLVHRLISLGHLWRVPAGLGFLPRC